MAYSEVEPLVFPDSLCLGECLYVKLFLVGALNRLTEMTKKNSPYWSKSLLLKQLLYAFSRKNKVL